MINLLKHLLKPDARRLILTLLLFTAAALIMDPLYLFLVFNIIVWYIFACILVFVYDRYRKPATKRPEKKPVKKMKKRGKRR